jgi:hypothetical protein
VLAPLSLKVIIVLALNGCNFYTIYFGSQLLNGIIVKTKDKDLEILF